MARRPCRPGPTRDAHRAAENPLSRPTGGTILAHNGGSAALAVKAEPRLARGRRRLRLWLHFWLYRGVRRWLQRKRIEADIDDIIVEILRHREAEAFLDIREGRVVGGRSHGHRYPNELGHDRFGAFD